MQETADRLAIMDVLCRYARGIDRCDADTLNAVWWPDATTDFGQGQASAADWVAATLPALRAMRRTQHMLGNMIIDIDAGIRPTRQHVGDLRQGLEFGFVE